MKKVLLVNTLIIASVSLLATVRTVSNSPSNPGQFSTIEAAVLAAVTGDTIYIHGSTIPYDPPITRKNNLTFIGPGHNPQKQNPLTVYVLGVFNVGANNRLIGLRLEGIASSGSFTGTVLSGLTIQRCVLYGEYQGVIFGPRVAIGSISGMLVEESVLYGVGQQMFWAQTSDKIFTDLNLRNCIFYITGTCSVFDNLNSASSGILIDHNIFISTGAAQPVFKAGFTGLNAGVSFTNNIFQNTNATVAGSVFNYFNNFSTLQSLNINGGSGNLQGASPAFVNFPGGSFSYTHDYHLAAGSPCIGTGIAGSDMGVYAGAAPFTWEGVAPIPQMNFINIIGTQAQQGGSIQVSFQSVIKN